MFKLIHIKEDNGLWELRAEFQYCLEKQIREQRSSSTSKTEAIAHLKYLVYGYFVMNCSSVWKYCMDAPYLAGHEYAVQYAGKESLEHISRYLKYMSQKYPDAEAALGYWLADRHHWKRIKPPKSHPWYAIINEHIADLFFTANHMLGEWQKPIQEQFTLKLNQVA
jgi:hypothetical protein